MPLVFQKGTYCKLSRRCKPPHERERVVSLGDKKGSFGYQEGVSGDIASNEKFAADCAALGVGINTTVTCQVSKPLWCYEIADLFVHFPSHALQKRLIAFTVTTEEPHHALGLGCPGHRPVAEAKSARKCL